MQEWVRTIAENVSDMGSGHTAVIREALIEQLSPVKSVSAPAKVVDGFLEDASTNRADSSLQGKAVALTDPEPWPDEPHGVALLNELSDTFTRYLALPEGAAEALPLWVLHCHAHEAAQVSPVLAITSPEKRCGKTTLLDLLTELVSRPLSASNVTAAAVFRTVDRFQPTLLLDEANTFLRERTQLRGILNSGHRRSQAFVVRTVGDDHEARQFGTWAPKAVALIGQLPDTLGDRSIEIRMRRRAPDEKVEALRRDRLGALEPLRRQAWTWAQARLEALEAADPPLPKGLNDRQQDNWRPLVAIADMVGGPWPDRVRKATLVLSNPKRSDGSLGTRLLDDVRRILEKHPSDRIRSQELVDQLSDLEEAPWSEYKGRGLSTRSLANFLRSFEVTSKDLRFGDNVYKGYEASAFEEAFRRYLEPPPSATAPSEDATPQQAAANRGPEGNSARNIGREVAGRESDESPDRAGDVAGVAPSDGNTRAQGKSDAREGNACPRCGRRIGPTAEICGRCKGKKQVEDRC